MDYKTVYNAMIKRATDYSAAPVAAAPANYKFEDHGETPSEPRGPKGTVVGVAPNGKTITTRDIGYYGGRAARGLLLGVGTQVEHAARAANPERQAKIRALVQAANAKLKPLYPGMNAAGRSLQRTPAGYGFHKGLYYGH